MSKKMTAQEYAEMRSEDPRQFYDNTNMDTSPAPAAGADAVCAAAMSAKVAEMQNELRAMQIEKDMLKKEKDIVVTSGDKAQTEASTTVFTVLKKLTNNQDTIWWFSKHVQALGAGDKPDWHKSYKEWDKEFRNVALTEYMGWDVVAGVGEDDE